MNILNPDRIKKGVQDNFQSILSQINGRKFLILSEDIVRKLSFVVPASLIKKDAYKVGSIVTLQEKTPPSDFENIVYFISPKVLHMKWIASHIRAFLDMKNLKTEFHVFMVPHQTNICCRVLREKGIAIGSDVNIGSFPLNLIPYEDDLLSLEKDEGFKEISVNGDFSMFSDITQSLLQFQKQFGIIPKIKGLGEHAVQCCRMLKLQTQEKILSSTDSRMNEIPSIPKIDQIFFIDRSMDLMSPFITQLTYEGLIDELFGITSGYFKCPTLSDLSSVSGVGGGDGRIFLNSTLDPVFREIRDLNQIFIAKYLGNKEKEINEKVKEKDTIKSVKELKKFVKEKLPQIKNEKRGVGVHFKIFQEIHRLIGQDLFRDRIFAEQGIVVGGGIQRGGGDSSEEDEKKSFQFIKDCIMQKEDLYLVLRLLCLLSFVKNGIQEDEYNSIKKMIYMTYGFRSAFLIENLRKAGLLKPFTGGKGEGASIKTGGMLSSMLSVLKLGGPSRQAWNKISQVYDLVDERKKGQNEYQLHQVFSWVSPLSIKFVKRFNEKWLDQDDREFVLGERGGGMDTSSTPMGVGTPTTTPTTTPTIGGRGGEMPPPPFSRIPTKENVPVFYDKHNGAEFSFEKKKKKVVMVFFIGGVTYAEVNALRYLNRREDSKFYYVAATTKIINGNTFLESMNEKKIPVKYVNNRPISTNNKKKR